MLRHGRKKYFNLFSNSGHLWFITENMVIYSSNDRDTVDIPNNIHFVDEDTNRDYNELHKLKEKGTHEILKQGSFVI